MNSIKQGSPNKKLKPWLSPNRLESRKRICTTTSQKGQTEAADLRQSNSLIHMFFIRGPDILVNYNFIQDDSIPDSTLLRHKLRETSYYCYQLRKLGCSN